PWYPIQQYWLAATRACRRPRFSAEDEVYRVRVALSRQKPAFSRNQFRLLTAFWPRLVVHLRVKTLHTCRLSVLESSVAFNIRVRTPYHGDVERTFHYAVRSYGCQRFFAPCRVWRSKKGQRERCPPCYTLLSQLTG